MKRAASIAKKVEVSWKLAERGVTNRKTGAIFVQGVSIVLAYVVDVANLHMRIDEVVFALFALQ